MKPFSSSMQLTRAADYGLRSMIFLATLATNQRLLLPDLAAATDAPVSFLSKVLQALTRAGLVESRRGKAGGFTLLPRGREATVRQVIEAIDGPIRLNVCLAPGKSCNRKAWCQAHPVWIEAQQAMLEVLGKARVADLSSPSTQPVLPGV